VHRSLVALAVPLERLQEEASYHQGEGAFPEQVEEAHLEALPEASHHHQEEASFPDGREVSAAPAAVRPDHGVACQQALEPSLHVFRKG